ncbi:Ig-like domain-containing protein [Pricia sp.]|uniref:Ig-like domain-containing protein n=1 Tax=Pricia sp. TaxID=2268138 RepID=UPI0035936A2A
MKFRPVALSTLLGLFFFACIGEDIIEDYVNPELRIRNPVNSLGLNESHQFEARYLNNIGLPEDVAVVWSSSDGSIVSIDGTGKATALRAGRATISATAQTDSLSTMTTLEVIGDADEMDGGTDETDDGTDEGADGGTDDISRKGSINSTSSYRLLGGFTIQPFSSGALELSLAENYEASTSLPGLYVYLTNNPNSINGALEIGEVTVFTGAHSYTLPENVAITDYSYLLYWCKPFSVKVGGGTINE